ncbi:MAG: excinuclease ABC subunit UvrB [Eubacteriales bacterium]|uniref:excinuclease ABC subunit UvrB n=1 Tax=Fenollaria sp. TaxID=1965292 RepID=UPI002A756C8A|nr:excinuclease ABC subunit UvrB [Fenollaria sp.]MDD7339254.1 excinuclease ABC subunit UvrB [Eubacteriales bacterium]MDY3106250.1 excinuclease ABC subunit UvrB [Fenollaria sp.]
MVKFKLKSDYTPTGDQPKAIESLSEGINKGYRDQVLLGVTGSGKTFTMANIIKQTQRPALVIAHNKTLAYQLYSEFKEFFPENSVEFFISYYDYYQPEAYVAATDTYIAKDSQINDDIDELRHSATAALFERKDVIIVASVSCIYGLGDPIDYEKLMVSLRPEMQISRDDVIKKLISIQYVRNDINFIRGTFRVRGDILDIFPASEKTNAFRIEFFGDEIDKILEIDSLTGEVIGTRVHVSIFPASHYATTDDKVKKAIESIKLELNDRLKWLHEHGKLVEEQRLKERTNYDLEMLNEIGFCSGIENYSRHLSQRQPGSRPYTLIDYFPKDFITFIDESHVSVPQIRAMYEGDRSRKTSLVDYGFRLPSALDNRPLKFAEFEAMMNQVIYVSATPAQYELERSKNTVEQVIRPTGLLDPIIEVRPTKGQIDDLIKEIRIRAKKDERVLITTLTKKMAEDLTKYLDQLGINVTYMHSDVTAIDRMQIIKDLREKKFDCLVGINLLREGLDLPEVSLVAILDADKEGFLRSETSLVQTAGRTARNSNGLVIMYADTITKSMESAINETARRRKIQMKYNEDNNITPMTIKKSIRAVIEVTKAMDEGEKYTYSAKGVQDKINKLTTKMNKAAKDLNFEDAAKYRDMIEELKKEELFIGE